MFSAVPRASNPIFIFSAPGHVFGGTEGVGFRFHVLHPRTRFRRYRGLQVPFSCFALPDSFLTVPWASGPVFKFCASGLIFGGTEGVKSRFHVFRSRTCFRRYRGRRVAFSCFARPDSFLKVLRASGPVFMFCTPELVFGGTEGVGSRIHVLRSRTHFRWYRGRPVPFSCFPLSNMFSAVPRASGPVFIFCATQLAFGGTMGVGSRFHFLRSRTRFRWYRGRQIPFSCFPLSNMFSAKPRASNPVFIFSAPGHVFDGTEGVEVPFSCFAPPDTFSAVLRASSPFSCFALPDSFSTVPRASGPVFMFCLTVLIFGSTEGVGSCFHVLCSWTRFRRY
jgi:hypothetical protein